MLSTLVQESPANFHHWFSYDHEIHQQGTRAGIVVTRREYFDVGTATASFTLHTKGSKNQHGEKMIQKSGPLIWNSIPDHIQGAPSIQTFKTNLKKYYFAQYDIDNLNSNDNRNDNHNNNHNNNNNKQQ